MSLKDITIKVAYSSDKDDILNEFYIPALSQTIKYYRLAGFFSSSTLAVAAKGIANFINNSGHMKLVCSVQLQREDIEAIKDNDQEYYKIIEDAWLRGLESFENELIENHVKALSWMISKEMLELKIAIITDNYNFPLEEKLVHFLPLFHLKIGILIDQFGNQISFSGSINESKAGWLDNIEEFKVFKNWTTEGNKYFQEDLKEFEKYWDNNALRCNVIDLPAAIKEKIIKFAPKVFKDLNLKVNIKKDKEPIIFREYQKNAINNWLNNKYRGIFEMATGSGKTYTALGCLVELLKTDKRLVTIIACPYGHLLPQWEESIKRMNLNINIMKADSSNLKWKNELTNHILDLKNEFENTLIILTTHQTLSTNEFKNILGNLELKILLIADEVHGLGAPKRKEAMNSKYYYRLGLSATPKRWFDEEGTEDIFNYFDKPVFEFSLKDAINTLNPDTNRTFLTPYEYIPHFVDLTEDELEKYEEATKRLAKAYFGAKNDIEKKEFLNLIAIKRQEIIKTASGKNIKLIDILDSFENIKNCLIYCEPHQIDEVQDILNSYQRVTITQHRFTGDEGLKPEKKYGGLSEREWLLKQFGEGYYQILVAMKCLDEGIDVPQAETAILMSSTGNPRQYIQRRGRILRRHGDKSKAVVIDIIIIPKINKFINQDLFELERKIVEKEMIRYKEFADASINNVDCLKKVEEIEKMYNITI